MKSKRKFSSEFKAKVAIEALKERSTLSEMSMKTPEKSREEEVDALYKKIGIFTKENLDGFIIN
ncbi:MAG: hypothetical protein MJ197_04245 [Bacteroidales bacterium]|nr:hypothetical protein [Bacteroidales bacterium]